jgi:CrcB protein
VNVVGSFVIGLVYGLTSIGVPLREFVMVGICGGYTTFSSFSLQTLTLIREDELLRAGANVVGSVVACVAAAWLGVVAAEASGQAGSLIASALSAWIGYLVAARLGQATKVSP